MPFVRSYGSVHDFSRLLLRLYERPDWTGGAVPSSIVPVTHTLDLNQLAHEVSAALGREIDIISSMEMEAPASIYVTSDFSYGAQLTRFGLASSTHTQQLRDISKGRAFLRAHE